MVLKIILWKIMMIGVAFKKCIPKKDTTRIQTGPIISFSHVDGILISILEMIV